MNTLYHYTSGKGLKGIIEDKELHCTHTGFLNDPSEITYFDALLNDVFMKNKECQKIYDAICALSTLQDTASVSHIFSLSEEKDALMMWNYYAQGDGYAIELNIDDIIKRNSKIPLLQINRIEYIKITQEELIQKHILSYVGKYEAFYDKSKGYMGVMNAISASEEERRLTSCFHGELSYFRSYFKSEHYKNEKEVRIRIPITKYESSNYEFRLSENGVLVEYRTLRLDIMNDIKSIMCHPGSSELHVQGAMRFMFCKHGLPINTVSKSEIPWRKV